MSVRGRSRVSGPVDDPVETVFQPVHFRGLRSWTSPVLSRPSLRKPHLGLGKSPPTSPPGCPREGWSYYRCPGNYQISREVQAMSQDDSLFHSVKFGELRMGPSSETLQTPVRRTRGHIYNLQSTITYLPGKLSGELGAISTDLIFAVTVNNCGERH